MALRLGWLGCLVLPAMLVASGAHAADPPKTPAVETPAQAQAREHFTKARGLYQAGSYREAIGELEAAFALDPTGKDLVFNLGVVHEKLGDIDDALKYFHRYEQMELDPQERSRADAFIKRLEGAKREVKPPPEPQPLPPPPPKQEEPPKHGRIDVLTIGAAVIAAGGIGTGVFFGLRATSNRPSSGYVTGKDGSFGDLQAQADKAHTDAIISDVGFAVGVVAAGAAAYLYFARTRDSHPRSGSITVSATPTPGGGAVILGGRF
jgi:tetratricopeptide (TPR) repeat protein